MPETDTTASRLDRWSAGHLDRIERDIAEHAATIAGGAVNAPDSVLRHAIEIERLRAEASLVRLLVADREVGVASMYYDLRPAQSGYSADIERARIKADGVLSFLTLHGDLFTDDEMRRIMCGPTAGPYRG